MELLWWLLAKDDVDFGLLLPFMILAILFFSIFALFAMLSYLYFSVGKPKSTTDNPTQNDMNTDTVEGRQCNDCIFNSQEIETRGIPSASMAAVRLAKQPRYSFNIFDGTNASGAFAAFIHDGDSDDENVDNAVTDYWADVQDHI